MTITGNDRYEAPQWFRDDVRRWVGVGHERVTDEQIDAVTSRYGTSSGAAVGRVVLYQYAGPPPHSQQG